MLGSTDNLISMSLPLNTFTPIFQRIRRKQGQKLNSGQSFHFVTRREPQRVYVFRILYAVNVHSLT